MATSTQVKKLNVYGVAWHVGHQFELARLPFINRYDLQMNPWRYWGEQSRPMPDNMRYVTEFDPKQYDLAILHVDQQSIWDPDNELRVRKGRLFYEMRETVGDSLPLVVINHMTPYHDSLSTTDVVEMIKNLVGDAHMIVNSYEAAKQWGWGTPIIHGMDPDEWFDLPKEPRCVVSLSAGGMEKAYRRIFLHAVARELKHLGVPFSWVGVDTRLNSFDEYREYIGRSLVYFNPTWQSPRPRSRTEAMLSGCCVVTTPYHDAHEFIEDGVTGFLTSNQPYKDPRIMDNPEYTAQIIKRLVVDEPETALAVGQRGKEYAQKHFNQETFAVQWYDFLTKKVGIAL